MNRHIKKAKVYMSDSESNRYGENNSQPIQDALLAIANVLIAMYEKHEEGINCNVKIEGKEDIDDYRP